MQVVEARGAWIINDSYNANPSVDEGRAGRVEGISRSASRRVAVLGSMGELGQHATELHRQVGWVGRWAKASEFLIAVGPHAEAYLLGAMRGGAAQRRAGARRGGSGGGA